VTGASTHQPHVTSQREGNGRFLLYTVHENGLKIQLAFQENPESHTEKRSVYSSILAVYADTYSA
jgi:hypothetical protein